MNLLSKISLLVVLLVYLFLGLSHSAQQGFWHDEIYTLTFLKGFSVYDFDGSIWTEQESVYDVSYFKSILAEDNFYSNFPTQVLHEGHPPLYFLSLKLWSLVFGTSEVSLRSFSLFCGLLTFLILFNLFWQRSKRKYTPWFLLTMLVFNPFLFYFFTEARMYALALLFATLSFRYWLYYQKHRKLNSYAFLFFCISSIGLLYTHYYGFFFLSTLAIIEFFRIGLKKSILNYSIAFICFIPWGLAIRKQLGFHTIHWTDGIISFGESIMGYFEGVINLLISPMTDPFLYEYIIIIAILFTVIVFLFINDRKYMLILFGSILIYGLQIYFFDQIVGNHTILTPRYYIFLLIFIYWGLFKMIDASYKISSILVTVAYTALTSVILLQLYKLERAPKQMIREVARFVDEKVDSKTRVLVIEPKGPLMVGIAYYLKNNFELIHADKTYNNLEARAVYIDEMLGVSFRENKYHNKKQEKLEFIPFVGIFLFK